MISSLTKEYLRISGLVLVFSFQVLNGGPGQPVNKAENNQATPAIETITCRSAGATVPADKSEAKN